MIAENNLIYQMKLSLALKQRKIFLNEDVTEDSIFECMYYLHRLIDIDNKLKNKLPIEIYVNTNGGLVTECLSLISMIEQMKDDGYCIITINSGKAYSAGFFIAVTGSIRKAYRYSEYMYHGLSAGTSGRIKTMTEEINHFVQSQELIHEIVKKYTKIPTEDLIGLDKDGTDKYYTPKEMLEYNAVDEIL